MLVFLSWSKPRSQQVAEALKEWLRFVLQAAKPWMSDADIAAGKRWSPEIAGKLAEAKFGVICVTPDNMEEPWLNFEAGACSKAVDDARVIPYLLDLEPPDVKGPLGQFQAKTATKDGTLGLLKSLNEGLQAPLEVVQLEDMFEFAWPRFSEKLSRIRASGPEPERHRRPAQDLLEEILQVVRGLERKSEQSPSRQTFTAAEYNQLLFEALRGPDSPPKLTKEELAAVKALSKQASFKLDRELERALDHKRLIRKIVAKKGNEGDDSE